MGGPGSYLTLCWLAFAISLAAFVIDGLTGSAIPVLSPLLQVIGLVPCGLAWLFARALFRPQASQEVWPRLLVAALFVSCLALHLDGTGSRAGLVGYVWQVQHFIASGVLALTLVEAIDGIHRDRANLAFRLCFAGGYLAIMATSFAVDLPENSDWTAAAQVAMASAALVLGTLAFQYRRRHPHAPNARRQSPARETVAMADPALAGAIERLLVEEEIYLDPDLKVADLAARLRVPDYKVSQAITGAMGHANFNQLINAHRIGAAEACLADPAQASRSILDIAMACGFGSLGPFNRAFKAKTGLTPSTYRRKHLQIETVPGSSVT